MMLTRSALALTFLLATATPAWACLGCGCGGSGVSSDLGAIGGAASIFSMGQRWMIQQGVSARAVTGSFNELGTWNPTPVDGSLTTLQGALGVSYFPTMGTSLSVQLPLVANHLNKASWGPLGSINPTDLGPATGAAFGDVLLQGSARLYEADTWTLGAFAGVSLPSGTATGNPESLSGSGVANGLGGVLALTQLGDWEFSGSLGVQRPFGRPELAAGTFYIGDAWMYQAQGNYRLDDTWRVGLGLNGFAGQGRFGANETPFAMRKLKLVPSVQHAFNPDSGVRLAVGYDPAALGTNAMTDVTAYAVFYQYMP